MTSRLVTGHIVNGGHHVVDTERVGVRGCLALQGVLPGIGEPHTALAEVAAAMAATDPDRAERIAQSIPGRGRYCRSASSNSMPPPVPARARSLSS
jgi:hypothetical protein